MTLIEVFVPVKTVSEGNIREHWHKAARRHQEQRCGVENALKGALFQLPCTVKLTRHGIRTLDSDNLQFSFKWVRDSAADFLVPGLKRGRADDDPRIEWIYDQKKVKRGFEGFRIQVDFSSKYVEYSDDAKVDHSNYKDLAHLANLLSRDTTFPAHVAHAYSIR